MNGRIAIDRQIMEWEWWGDINVFRLWMVILMLANWQDKKWQGKVIKRGSFVTSYASLSDASGLSIKQTRTAIAKLKSTGEIQQIVTNKYQLIIVANYEKYQENFGNLGNQTADKGQAEGNQRAGKGQQLNKDNKGNKGNKEKEGRFTPPTLSEVQAYITEKGYHVDAESFIDFYASKGWMVGKNKMKDWKASVRTWEKRNNGTDNKECVGQTHNRGTERKGEGISGATVGSGSGNGKGKTTFPSMAYSLLEEARCEAGS